MKSKSKRNLLILVILSLSISMLLCAMGVVFAVQSEKSEYFASNEQLAVENNANDTRGVKGVALTLKGVNGKDRIAFDYRNYISKSELAGGFLELAFLPQTVNKADFDYALITLTDAQNENQKLVYAVAPQPETSGWWYDWSVAWVGLTDNLIPATSVKYQFNSMLQIENTEQYVMGYNQSFISPSHIYYTGPYMEVGYNLNRKDLYFVKSSEDAPLNSLTFSLSDTSALINGNLIANLTDENFISASSAMLAGTEYEKLYSRDNINNLFSSGYCTLNVTFLGCRSENITCHIRKIGGQWIENNPDGGVVNASPMIIVKHDTHAVEGVPFKFPETLVIDFREGNISNKASYSFKSRSGDTITHNGNSVNLSVGEYLMQCSIRLETGEVFTVDRSLTSYGSMPKTIFSINDDFEESYKTGDVIIISAASAINSLSTAENKRVSISAVLQIEGVTKTEFDLTTNNYYTLKESGEYVLSYIFQNKYGVINSKSFAFSVDSGIGITPDFIPVTLTSEGKNNIADFMIVNYVNHVPNSEIYRAAYVDGVQVFLAKGDTVLEGSYIFSGELDKTSVKLIYKTGFDKHDLIYSSEYVIPVISPQYAEDYIVQYDKSGNFERSAQTVRSNEEIIFKTEKDAGFMLPQPLPAAGLEFSFDVKAGGEFQKLNVVIRDYIDYNKRLVFSLARGNANTSLLYLNGVYEATVNGSLINDNNYFQWSLGSDNTLSDQLGNTLVRRVEYWEDGSSFNGFGNGLVVLCFELEEVTGETCFALRKVNNQPFFTSAIGDKIQRFDDVYPPIISVNGAVDYNKCNLGDEAVILSAQALDVLSPESTVKVSVTCPTGEVIIDKADCHEPLSFIIDMHGRWTVEYVAYDANDLFQSEQRYSFNIKDKTPPNIYLNGEVPSTGKVGKVMKFPSAYVFDNVTQDCKYYIIIIAPNGVRSVVKDNKFSFTVKGEHIAQYYAYDDDMNVSRLSFNIAVS